METKKRIVNARITNIFTFPESCPIGNPKNPQTMMKWLKKVDTISTKHGLSVVGIWTDRWGHKTWAMYDTPNMEAFEEFE